MFGVSRRAKLESLLFLVGVLLPALCLGQSEDSSFEVVLGGRMLPVEPHGVAKVMVSSMSSPDLLLTEEVEQTWTEAEWVNEKRTLYSYDMSGNMTENLHHVCLERC